MNTLNVYSQVYIRSTFCMHTSMKLLNMLQLLIVRSLAYIHTSETDSARDEDASESSRRPVRQVPRMPGSNSASFI